MPTIAENLQRLVDAKSDIADAITAKGGTVSANDGFEEFPSDIATIPSGVSGKYVYDKDPKCYVNGIHCTPKQVKPIFEPESPVSITWYAESRSSLSIGNSMYIWTDGEDVFYSDSSNNKHYMLNKSTSTGTNLSWTEVTITPTLTYHIDYIWSDGTNTYYSNGSAQYIWNKSTFTWETKTWNGVNSFVGKYTWTDGSNIYLSTGTSNYILNQETSTWSNKAWVGMSDIYFYGYYVWTDGSDIYYSTSSKQRVLDTSTSTWSTKAWTGLTSFIGNYIWTDGTDIYYSYGTEQYVLDKSTSTWITKTWSGVTSFYGDRTWIANGNVYVYNNTDNNTYVLNRTTYTWSMATSTALILFSPFATKIWTDGTDIYHSDGTEQYVLDKSTSTWLVKTWYGLTDFIGTEIWTDGANIFYSYGSGTSGSNYKHYILNKSTSRWYSVNWSGAAYYGKCFRGSNIWSVNGNTFLSTYPTPGTSSNYVYHFHLVKSPTLTDRNGTWEYASFGGGSSGTNTLTFTSVWTDGTVSSYGLAIYGTTGNKNYKLKIDTSTGAYSWSSTNPFNIGAGSSMYALRISTDGFNWIVNGSLNEYGSNDLCIWTDGDKIYMSNGGIQYIMPKFVGIETET